MGNLPLRMRRHGLFSITHVAVLTGRYKGKRYECVVLESEGATDYSLEDGSIHASLSAAASKLMDGASVNGWRLWSLAAEVADEMTPKAARPSRRTAEVATKTVKVIKRVPNQRGVAEGSRKWWCSACMKGFVAEGTLIPDRCPKDMAARRPTSSPTRPRTSSPATNSRGSENSQRLAPPAVVPHSVNRTSYWARHDRSL